MSNNIAVIMSVYKNDNINEFIESINSIINQTVSSDIYIFRDGLISSAYESTLSKLEVDFDFIYIVRNTNNIGLASALNNLIELIVEKKYDYVARMDSDDISRLNRFSIQSEFLCKNIHVDVVGSYCHEFGSDFSLPVKKLPLTHSELVEFSITRCPFIHPAVMFRASIFMDEGIRYPTNTSFTEDMALWFVMLDKDLVFENIPKVLLDYRMTNDTALRRKGFNKALSEISLRFKYMIKLKRVSFRNAFLIFGRLILHVLPVFLLKKLYLNLR